MSLSDLWDSEDNQTITPTPKLNLEFEFVETQEKVRKHIQACEGKHSQQVVYSTFHDALTQVCYGCKKVRSSTRFL